MPGELNPTLAEIADRPEAVGEGVSFSDRPIGQFGRQVIELANRVRPAVEFLEELHHFLLGAFRLDGVGVWLCAGGRWTRWEATREPWRFYRFTDLAEEDLARRPGWLPIVSPFSAMDGARGPSFGSAERPGEIACLPLRAGENYLGVLWLWSREHGRFTGPELSWLEIACQTIAVATNQQQLTLSLRERVKELSCLYAIAQIAATPKLPMGDLLQGVVECLPPAWQYPEICAARIVLDDQCYLTARFGEKIVAAQRVPIHVDSVERGRVEVVYLESRPEVGEGPFLLEERKLVDTIGSDLALIIQRKAMEADRPRLQAQLRHADRLATIGQLAAGVAHELNEPLGGILGFSQLIRKHPDLPKQVEKDVSRIEDASLYAREIIRKLMLFARKTQPSKRPVQLNQIVEEGLSFLSARCFDSGIELVRQLEPNLPCLTADPAQLMQVVVNLVVNALQAMPQGGALSIATRAEATHVTLSVTDTGLGMPERVMSRIFDPFFTTKDVGEGTGLGLPVVHGIVCAHGGVIQVKSEEGSGTCFEVRLPLQAPEAMAG